MKAGTECTSLGREAAVAAVFVSAFSDRQYPLSLGGDRAHLHYTRLSHVKENFYFLPRFVYSLWPMLLSVLSFSWLLADFQ